MGNAMTDMIERAARAIHFEIVKDEFPEANNFKNVDLVWDNLNAASKEGFKEKARAAIAALREPSEEMLAAAMEETATDLKAEWQAMIDSILED